MVFPYKGAVKKTIQSLFPTLIYRGALPKAAALNRKLVKEIGDFCAQDRMGREWSKKNYRGGYTSYGSLSDMQFRSPLFAELAEKLQPHAESYARAQGWQRRGLSLVMNALWMNVMGKNTFHAFHIHPHSVISGTYYVRTPKNSVSLRLEDPRMSLYMNAPVRESSMLHKIPAKAGSFVMFESWLRHEVPPINPPNPESASAFNYSLE